MEENSRAREDEAAIAVRVYKYDGREDRRWEARMAKQVGPLIVLDAVFDQEIEHDLLGKIAFGTISTEYYWLDRWYNAFRYDGRFYCNVTTPPVLNGSILSYIDLDIDVLVESDFSYKVLDLDDFEANRYPRDVEQHARQALEELIGLVETKSFPFNE